MTTLDSGAAPSHRRRVRTDLNIQHVPLLGKERPRLPVMSSVRPWSALWSSRPCRRWAVPGADRGSSAASPGNPDRADGGRGRPARGERCLEGEGGVVVRGRSVEHDQSRLYDVRLLDRRTAAGAGSPPDVSSPGRVQFTGVPLFCHPHCARSANVPGPLSVLCVVPSRWPCRCMAAPDRRHESAVNPRSPVAAGAGSGEAPGEPFRSV